VLNYEEGGEKCLLHGDDESEKLLSEIVGAGAYGACVRALRTMGVCSVAVLVSNLT
jgi:hypothetical protein